MALRKIFKEGETVLKKRSKKVVKFDNRLAQLLDDMKETLKEANGVGLAAPQVGVLKQIIIIEAGNENEARIVELINPEIISRTGEQIYYEGCLSFPGYYGNVGRPEKVILSAQNRDGDTTLYEAAGLYAVVCCHETDHLDGVMFMQKVIGRLYTLEEVKAMRENKTAEPPKSATQPADGQPEAARPDEVNGDGYFKIVDPQSVNQ